MMDAGVLLTLVGSVLSGGGVLAVARLYLERRKPAADVRAVEVATQGGAVEMSVKLAASAMEQVRQMGDDLLEARAESREALARAAEAERSAAEAERSAAEAERRATTAERRATEAESTVDELAGWAHDLVTRWPEVRQSVTPPALPPLIRRRWAKTGGLNNG